MPVFHKIMQTQISLILELFTAAPAVVLLYLWLILLVPIAFNLHQFAFDRIFLIHDLPFQRSCKLRIPDGFIAVQETN